MSEVPLHDAPTKVIFTAHLLRTLGETLGIAVVAYLIYLVARRFAPKSWAQDILGTRQAR